MGLKPFKGGDRPLITDRNYRFEYGQSAGKTIAEIIEDPQQRGLLLWAQKKLEDFDLHHSLLESAELDDDDHRSYWDRQTYWYVRELRETDTRETIWDLTKIQMETAEISSS